MARFRGPKGKIVRRFGVNIFDNDKYDRLLQRRSDGPGQHGARRSRKTSDFALQLMEKQKLRYSYGLLERQFRRVFHQAQRMPGVTGDNMLVLLESRLDSLAFRAGFGRSLTQARQLVNHGHLKVNGQRVDIPSYQVMNGDTITLRDRDGSRALATRYLNENPRFASGEWFAVDRETLTVKVHRLPLADEISSPANESLIVEYYSK
ncbi:MAG TPA: 30S ribosomal protein S4 [Geopsychrobacteraceae bacterium]|nr:30S ribosomal protein S4 [Geopsychrobacteraceae bacterium]